MYLIDMKENFHIDLLIELLKLASSEGNICFYFTVKTPFFCY